MSQEQLCECGQRSGTNSDCTVCRFVSTEQSLRRELHDALLLNAHYVDVLRFISTGKCEDDSHSPGQCYCSEMRATVALNAPKMREICDRYPGWTTPEHEPEPAAIKAACPYCHTSLGVAIPSEYHCPKCGRQFRAVRDKDGQMWLTGIRTPSMAFLINGDE